MKTAVASTCAFMPMNSSETKAICTPAARVHPHPPTWTVDHYSGVTQPRFSSLPAALSRSVSRLADNYIDSTTDCSYKLNSEYLSSNSNL